MKKIITASLVAMMAVSAANAEIASVEYVSGKTGDITALTTTNKSNLMAAINELAAKAGSESVADVKSALEDQIGDVDDKVDANAEAIQGINSSAVMGSGITAEKVQAYEGYAAQIAGKQDALGYTAENQAYKVTDTSSYNSYSTNANAYPNMPVAFKMIADGNASSASVAATAQATADAAVLAAGDAQDTADQAVADAAAASQAAAQALTDAKAYADGLATNYDAAGAAATALSEAKTYAEGEADAAESAAKLYADGLASNYDAAGSADAALAAAKEDAKKYIDADELEASQTAQDTTLKAYADKAAKDYADGLAGNYETAGAAAGALTAAKAYTDELANGQVKTNTEAIAALDATYVSESEMTTFKASNTDAIADAKKAGTDASAALSEYKTSNDVAVSAAAATANTAVQRDQVGMTEQFAITDECKAEGAVCSLVVRGGNASWEKIAY